MRFLLSAVLMCSAYKAQAQDSAQTAQSTGNGASAASEDNSPNSLSGNITDIISRLDADEALIYALLSGRQTITGIPQYNGGITFKNVTGNALTFNDGTTQNTAPTNGAGGAGSTTTAFGYSNFWVMFSSGDSVSQATTLVTFTDQTGAAVAITSRTCAVEFSGVFTGTNDAFNWDFYFNNDTNANYAFGLDATNAANEIALTAAHAVPFNADREGGTTHGMVTGSYMWIRVEFETLGKSTKTRFRTVAQTDNNWQTVGVYSESRASGIYTGAAPPSTIRFASNSSDVSSAGPDATQNARQVHWEYWCKGFGY